MSVHVSPTYLQRVAEICPYRWCNLVEDTINFLGDDLRMWGFNATEWFVGGHLVVDGESCQLLPVSVLRCRNVHGDLGGIGDVVVRMKECLERKWNLLRLKRGRRCILRS